MCCRGKAGRYASRRWKFVVRRDTANVFCNFNSSQRNICIRGLISEGNKGEEGDF